MRVAVIGLGYFSAFHLSAWVSQAGTTVVGVTDLDPRRRTWASEMFDVPVFETSRELLDQTSSDIVDIVAPPSAHAALISDSLGLGRIIICQKPFCTSLDEAREIADRAQAAGAIIVIHENFRFQPWHRTIRDFLDSDNMGRIYQARFLLRPGDGRGKDAYLSRQPSFQTMPRLLIHETGVHFIDLFRWFFGEIEAVYADLRHLNPVLAGEDTGLLVLDHVGGVQSVFDGNRLSDHPSDQLRRTMGEMWIEGEGGTLSLDGAGVVRFRAFGQREPTVVPIIAPIDDKAFGGGCVAALIAHVAERADRPELIENRVEDYLPVIAATDAAYASAETSRKITIRQGVV